jgi:hypothetical protein
MTRRTLALIASMTLFAAPALAGPPLLCFPYEIGSSKSLPWGKDAFQKNSGYDTATVVEDTLKLLKTERSALVRMETLRRAAIYIGKDSGLATELLAKISWIAMDGETTGKPTHEAWFNAGFLAATLRQSGCDIKWHAGSEKGVDGYAYIKKALAIAPDDAAMQFGAALVAFDHDRDAFKAHVQKALTLVEPGSDLARSIETNHALGAKPIKELKAQYAVTDASKK